MRNAVVKPFDVSRLEEDVRDLAQQKPPHVQAIDYAPRTSAPPVPEYVSHRDDATEIGKLSAEVSRQAEALAELREAIANLHIQFTAALIRIDELEETVDDIDDEVFGDVDVKDAA